MSRIFVTGMGVISAIGNNLAENHIALSHGKCGIGKATFLQSKYTANLPFGEVKLSTEELRTNLEAFAPQMTRTTLLALHACQEAISNANLNETDLQSYDTALIGASTVGGMCLIDELYNDANKKSNGSPYLSSYDASSIDIYLQKHFNVLGICNTFNTACSSSANAIMYGARLLKNGFAKRAIVGGVDSLSKFTVNGFNALHILSDEICTPFDQGRKGLNLGEGAAYLVLEKEDDLKGKKVYAELTGYCNSNDAFHPSSLSSEGNGPFLAMQGALKIAKLNPQDISFVNVHGTGTENNDLSESKAMLRLFEKIPPFASTKSNIGHTLGASGAIEAVYSILNLIHQEVYPHLNFQTSVEGTDMIPIISTSKIRVENVLSNSFGFGGNCSSLLFSNIK